MDAQRTNNQGTCIKVRVITFFELTFFIHTDLFNSSQSNELQLNIDSITKSNDGTYVCLATNDIGEARKEIQINGNFYNFMFNSNNFNFINF